MGEMSEYFNGMYGIDIGEALHRRHLPKTFTCKKCKTKGLTWKQNANGNWWLYDKNEWHKCRMETKK